ncbi:hypothetical protein BD309DRAFT_998116 [Dichomitus squalens]|nr:hypothetical protein BD309DRAFT_998116 [Dichomitus squalens]
MGGNAFKRLLPHATFPRMHPAVYNALKAQVLPIVQSFYAHATVSPEAPEKADFGDLDIIVAGPRDGLTHEEVRAALRATCSIPQEGNRTSNFAIPVDAFEAVAQAHKAVAAASEPKQDGGARDADAQVTFQVDLNVNGDCAQWERTVFCSSYGDLVFFLGVLAQTAGLSFSIYGLRLAEPIRTYPPQTYYLSYSMDDILSFFGLSMDRWRQGFTTQHDIFAWLATSPFIHVLVARYRSPEYEASTKERLHDRPMRMKFINYLRTQELPACTSGISSTTSLFAVEGNVPEKIDAALRFFGKAEERAALVYASRAQKRAKELLNGTNLNAWTGVNGKPIRFVMDEVKERLGCLPAAGGGPASPVTAVVEPWQRALSEMEEEELRTLVVSVKEEMEKDGRLEFDWRAAKTARLEKKQQQQQREEVIADPAEEQTAAAVAVA